MPAIGGQFIILNVCSFSLLSVPLCIPSSYSFRALRSPAEQTQNVSICVLVFACNRPTIKRNLDQLIKYRPDEQSFPIVVSQDCGHEPTRNLIQSYGTQLTLIQHPDLSDIKLVGKTKKFKGYYKISRHYKWALSQVFETLNYQTVIIVEDDLDIAPDFFEYFRSTYPILRSDPTLWCVSAYNDNGKQGLIQSNAGRCRRICVEATAAIRTGH